MDTPDNTDETAEHRQATPHQNGGDSDREWLAISAVRDAFSIARRSPATYRDAVAYAIQIAPDWIGPNSLLASGIAAGIAEYYRAKAATISGTGREVSPLELARADLAEVDGLLAVASETDAIPLLRRRRDILRAISELDEIVWTETQALVSDYGLPPTNDFGPLPLSGRGQSYLEYRAAPRRAFRVRLLHPDPPEWKLGLDLVYESYSLEHTDELQVRIAALQYKTWNGRNLYLSDGRTEAQMSKAHEAFCKAALCTCKNTAFSGRFRFPHCCVFLRPTDRVQTRRGWQATRGWHVPMCEAGNHIEDTSAGGRVIRADAIRPVSLNQAQFSALFGQGMIGSDWIPAVQLEGIYHKAGVMDADRPVLHVQEYPIYPEVEDEEGLYY